MNKDVKTEIEAKQDERVNNNRPLISDKLVQQQNFVIDMTDPEAEEVYELDKTIVQEGQQLRQKLTKFDLEYLKSAMGMNEDDIAMYPGFEDFEIVEDNRYQLFDMSVQPSDQESDEELNHEVENDL